MNRKQPVNLSKTFKATLTNPSGINKAYRISYNRKTRKHIIVKSSTASSWETSALLQLRQQGFTPQPEQPYWCSIKIDLYTSRLDIDAPIKSTLDLIMKSLSVEKRSGSRRIYCGVEDKWFGNLSVYKHFTTPKIEQRVEVEIEIIPIKTKKDFNAITKERKK